MADLDRTISIIFEGVDRMGAGVDSASRRIRSVTDSVDGVAGPIAGVTTDILKFEAALAASGVAATGLAVKLAGDFDSQFREIATLIDAPTEALDEFKESIKGYGRESTKSLEEINNAVYSAISAGADYTDSLDVVRAAEKLAVAGQADLGESLTTLVSSLNAYGKGMDEAESFSDLLFQTVRSGQTTLPELGNSLASVTGLAATAGVEFDELLSAVATLTATGSSTSEAVTQIRGAISNILKPTKQAKELAAELGIEFNAAALESKGFAGLMGDVGEATGGSTEQMSLLFGDVNALNGALTLTGLGAEKFAGTLDDMESSAGATDAAFEKMGGTVEEGSQRIVNAFKGMMIEVGDPLLDEFGGIQEAIAEIFNAIGASVSDGQLESFVEAIEGVMQSLESTLSDVATNLPDALDQADLSGYIDGFNAVRDAVGGLFDNADLTTAEGLASVIETLGAGVESLGEFTGGAIETLGPFIEKLAELAQWVTELDPELVATAGAVGGLGIAATNILAGIGGLVTIVQALGGSGGAVPVATRAVGMLVAAFKRFAGPAGAAVLAYESINHVMGKIEELNNQPLNLSEQWKKDAQEIEDEGFSLGFIVGKDVEYALAAFESLKDEFGWGDDAAADFEQLSQAAIDAANQVAASAGDLGDDGGQELEQLSQTAINMATLIGQARDKARDGLDRVDAPLLDQFGDLPDSLSRVADILDQGSGEVTASAEVVGKSLNKISEAFNAGEIDASEYERLKKALLGLRDGADKAAKGQKVLTDEVLTNEDAILKARDAVLQQELALEELASNERIKGMEFAVDFKMAQLENDTRRVESILSATSETITSTAEAATNMFDTLSGGNLTGHDRVVARRAIDQQLEIEKTAAEKQAKLIDAQINSMKAKTKALQQGDGLIKIESDGLEPALEMIMWEVLEKIQMRANAEGAEFLLGL